MSIFDIVLMLSIIVAIILGIKMMSSPKTARSGNLLASLAVLGAVIHTLISNDIITIQLLWIALVMGSVIGYFIAVKVAMIQMPQFVAILNGFGGAASALVALVVMINSEEILIISAFTSILALAVGGITFSGSMVAAAKLAGKMDQKPIVIKNHTVISLSLLGCIAVIALLSLAWLENTLYLGIVTLSIALVLGIVFTIRVGGADMPVTISLLNSFSGLAASIAGFAVNNLLLVAIGAVVGSAGIILTKTMCKAMNRSLFNVLTGRIGIIRTGMQSQEADQHSHSSAIVSLASLRKKIHESKKVIVIPGYGMAVAQAQSLVRDIVIELNKLGKDVKVAIHPVAGRMPGHMNVLLAEADLPYEYLYELDKVNDQFPETDTVLVVGANDVINPAAIQQEGTPIYGMPILRADLAKHVIICNYDTSPGYSGIENPLYKQDNVTLLLGNAAQTLHTVKKALSKAEQQTEKQVQNDNQWFQAHNVLDKAKSVIIIPGYGMAVAQAQGLVKQLFDRLTADQKQVKVAIHPVAGRMPGHMNVLLAEVDLPYDKLYELETINHEFSSTDVVVIVGANDVVNPAAIKQEGTPIYGMPILNAYESKHIIICNYDTKPGYSGVDNPLYEQDNTILLLGDAEQTVSRLLEFSKGDATKTDLE